MTQQLSPAAQAVLTAVTQHQYSLDPEDVPNEACRIGVEVALALRAAADQVVPEDYDPPTKNDEFIRGMVAGKTLRNMDVRAALYRIAAELEGQ